jgi:hypothetical protein
VLLNDGARAVGVDLHQDIHVVQEGFPKLLTITYISIYPIKYLVVLLNRNVAVLPVHEDLEFQSAYQLPGLLG